MKQAGDVEANHCFRWQNDLYVVKAHEDNYCIVERIASYWPEETNPGNSGWKFIADQHRHAENFNPYCEVDTEFSPERKLD